VAVYDAVAPTFDRHRAMPEGVADAIRSAILASIGMARPRVLDLGAGTGRIGWPFVSADDDYVGVDLSFGMLREFIERAASRGSLAPRVVQSNGELLPFRDAAFDAVLLIQVFGGLRGWRRLVAEARRVLRAAGTLCVGRTVAPADGIDARMKHRAASLIEEMNIETDRMNARDDVRCWLESASQSNGRLVAAEWISERTPRGFLDRHRTGKRFSALAEPVKQDVLRKLEDWAVATFGSLEAAVPERYLFELQVFKF
jgi:ubiquinone/menaquinone biosynthesis C-methylase UbiE